MTPGADPRPPDAPRRWTADEMDERAELVEGHLQRKWCCAFHPDDAAMLRQGADALRVVARVREWLVEPIGTAEQMSALLIAGLGLQEEYADIAAVVALKTIQDAREELAALLSPTGGSK